MTFLRTGTETAQKSHTPGPWLQSSTMLVCNEEARVIANCTPMIEIPELAIPIKEVEANARLISAAPELLAALERIVQLNELLPEDSPSRLSHGEAEQAIAAIKKAKA